MENDRDLESVRQMFQPRRMRIRSIFMLLVIYISFESNASNEIIQFGFKTDGLSGHANTLSTITITLWFESTIYQVLTNAPQESTWFTFNKSQEPYFGVIGRNCFNITQPKIMFELDSNDAVCVDAVQVITQSGDWYGIDSDDLVCIDNEPHDNAPYKQIMYFDTTRPNVYINDAAWSDGTDVDPFSDIYQCVVPTGLTAKYGDDGGDFYSVLDQGRVYAMLDWGLESNKYLQIRGWKADSQSTETVYGVGRTRSSCTPFTLSSDDYITGYQIWFDSNGISGVMFWTRNDRTLPCIGISDSSTTSYANSFDYGPFNFSYLTGWNVWSGAYIDQIQFQFTKSLLTASPTQIPSVSPSGIPTSPSKNPAAPPSAMPTYNTNHPSQMPSSHPTDLPTDNPSNAPSRNPMYNITPSHVIGTEGNEGSITTEIVSSPLNRNKNPINILAVIVFILALCAVCAAIGICAICVYSKKHNIQFLYPMKVGNVVRDVDECDAEKQPGSGQEIEERQKQNQMNAEVQFAHNEPKPPHLNVEMEGNTIIPHLVMAGSAIMTKDENKIELAAENVGSSHHITINAELVMSGSAIMTQGKQNKVELAAEIYS